MAEVGFEILEFETLADLTACLISAPAIGYVRETGSYFFKYEVPWELKSTPFYSGLGQDWHPADVSSPRFDRPIHVINTRWLNGQDLDFYADFVWKLQGTSFLSWDDLYRIHGSVFPPPSTEEGTTIDAEQLHPGDLIFRYQRWEGVTVGAKGDTVLAVAGLETEIADKYGTSFAAEGANSTVGKPGSILFVGGREYPVISHSPNNFDDVDQYDHETPWKPTTEPTTQITLAKPLEADINADTPFVIVNRQWYCVSLEIQEPCPTHLPHCFPIFRIAGGDAPARFDRVCHRLASKDGHAALVAQKKVLPGDFEFHEKWTNWYQAIGDGPDQGHVGRYLTVQDRAEFDKLKTRFALNHHFVLNRTHQDQKWRRQVPIGINGDFTVVNGAARLIHRPADWCYVSGEGES